MNLTEKTLLALKGSPYWHQRTRISGNTIQGIVCPVCGNKSAWAYSDSPMSINCNKLSSCGAHTRTLELFNIRQDIENDYPATKSDPHRPALEYLRSRGISKAVKGLKFQYWKDVRKISGAVMFPIGKDEAGKTVFNGRLFNPKEGDGKTHNSGSTSGLFWQHPGIEYDPGKKTYLTEGIIDALSLLELGNQAIAVIASGQDPAKLNLSHLKNLVLAFDADQAGARATKKWLQHHPEAEAIMPDRGQDWNDLLQSGPLEQIKKQFTQNLPRYRVNAQLALAGSSREYAEIFKDFFGQPPGLFIFDGCTWYSFSKKRGDESYLMVERMGKFSLEVVSYLKDTSHPEQPEFQYHLQITPKNNRPVYATATGRDLATPRGMKEFFLTRAKVSYEGGASASTALATFITGAKSAPEVNQLAITGYQPGSGWYVYKHYAIDPAGKLHSPNKRGLYKTGYQDWSKPPAHAAEKAIKPAGTGQEVKAIYKLIQGAWGKNGVTAAAWLCAGWFVNQIKKEIGFFPFLSFHGDPASGKSALTVMLNALQGHDGEGLPLSQLNTKKALARTISRESGRLTALLEDNQRNERAFDYSILLTGYNQGPLQLKAAFSNDNRTEEAPFLGSLLFVQNTEPFNQKAEKQRVISLHFNHTDLSDKTRAVYEQLVKTPLPQLARVMLLTLQQRKIFEENWFKEYEKAIDDLAGVDNRRILQNHALVLAFHRLFCKVHGIRTDLTEFILETAQTKCRTSEIKDYSLADHFFETLDLLDPDKTASCVHVDDKLKLLYINLPAVEQLIRNKGAQFSYHDNLGKALMNHPAFMKNSHRFRFPADPETDNRGQPKQRRAWVFNCMKLD